LPFGILFILPLTWHQPWDGASRKMKEALIEVQQPRYEVDSVEASVYERFWAANSNLMLAMSGFGQCRATTTALPEREKK
jgi:hypothetical protein